MFILAKDRRASTTSDAAKQAEVADGKDASIALLKTEQGSSTDSTGALAPEHLSIDIFCNVIDNYGDAGVCLHLARTLSQHNYEVRLFCNNLKVLETLLIEDDRHNEHLKIQSWEAPLKQYTPGQVVISAFSCRLDKVTLNALRSGHRTININLEYLSAEDWVESFHGLPSPQNGYMSYFFFPGFTEKTGGLNIDQSFIDACLKHQEEKRKEQQHKSQAPCASVIQTHQDRHISLFGYHNATVLLFLQSLQRSKRRSIVTVFTGLALDNINELLQLQLKVGDTWSYGKVTLKVSPMLPHEEYDQVLLSSDFNLVRGEDSIVRALHTGNPFLWQIYPQDEKTHITKLKSFLEQVRRINLEVAAELSAPPVGMIKAHKDSTAKSSAGESEIKCSSNSEPLSTTTTVSANTTGSTNESDSTTTCNSTSCLQRPHYIKIKADQLERALEQINNIMLAYNEDQPWPNYFDFDTFEQECSKVFYNFAQYLCSQEPLAIRLDRFIRQKIKEQE